MRTDELTVYRDTYEFTRMVMKELKNFPRFERYTIGEELLRLCIKMPQHLARANRNKAERISALTDFLIDFESARMIIRLCADEQILKARCLSRLTEKAVNIERQVTGWKNSSSSGGSR